jgi:CBS domain-containing protein
MSRIENLITQRSPLVLERHTSVLEATRAMTARNVGAVVIADPAGRPVGIFTERDLMTRVVAPGRNPAQVTLGDVMTTRLLLARCDEPVETVEGEMQRLHVRHLPVIDASGRLLGVVSLRDLLREDLRAREEELHALHDYICSADAAPTNGR